MAWQRMVALQMPTRPKKVECIFNERALAQGACHEGDPTWRAAGQMFYRLPYFSRFRIRKQDLWFCKNQVLHRFR